MNDLDEGLATADAAGGAENDWAAALAEQASGDDPGNPAAIASAYAPASLEPLSPTGQNQKSAGLDSILDIPITLSVEIGKAKLSIRNLLQLNQGSVVELERMAGEPLDVMINGTLVAHGEVVVVNEKYGVRLTDVVSAQERVRKLK
ncbi:MAG: flagellar motor switch protein FliN [Gammaproteobacteria bacterium]|nr:flagellar motor switch protein FliN [Gammaproteobacteria bacterium]